MPALSQPLEFINYNNTASVQVVYPLFTNTNTTLVYYSGRVQGDGYYGSSDGFHTVAITASNDFIGTATIQASLATSPSDSDWFNVTDATVTYTAMNERTTATVDCFNFTGNFVWVRGCVQIESGAVESILYNH